jgi:hypothetical protein
MIEVPIELHSLKLQREIAWVMQMDSKLCGIPVPLPVGMKVTTPLYSFREKAHVQRWSDTEEVPIKPDSHVEYWKTRGKIAGRLDPSEEDIEKFRSVLGGVPRLRSELKEFAELAAHMATCPYNDLIVTDATDIAA